MKNITFGLAAVFCAAIFGCNSTENLSEKLFAEKFEFYPNTLIDASRSDAEEAGSSHLKEIMNKYDSKNYEAALEGLNQYLLENPDYYKAKFYRGMIYLKNKELNKATEDFEEVVNAGSAYKEEAEWYLSLCYIRAAKKEEAVALLTQITHSSSTQAQRAEDLLKHVNEWPN